MQVNFISNNDHSYNAITNKNIILAHISKHGSVNYTTKRQLSFDTYAKIINFAADIAHNSITNN